MALSRVLLVLKHVYFSNSLCGFQGVSVDTFCALEYKIQWTTFAFKQKYQSQFFNIRDFIFI